MQNLSLYGFPSGFWKVDLPAREFPPVIPEPASGINFSRDAVQQQDWLSLVACHCDAWLLLVAFYFGARFSFDYQNRKRLYTMTNDLRTIFEVVTGTALKQAKSDELAKYSKKAKDEDAELYEVKGSCGICWEVYVSEVDKEFWINCNRCHKWYHGKCVNITPAKAEYINLYKCPSCSYNRIAMR